MKLKDLSSTQKQLRKRIIEVSYKRKLSHIGSCLSTIDLIEAIYQVKKTEEKFILSCGHSGIALYAILEKYHYLSPTDLNRLHIHPDRNIKKGIHVSTGSLGQGLPIAIGMALADKKKNVYCLISDGECSEGSIWESLRVAVDQKVNNLIIILNANGWGAYDAIQLKTLYRRIKAFGSLTLKLDGHNLKTLKQALRINHKDKPLLIFAHTQSSQFPFLKGLDAHYHVMNDKDCKLALELLK